MGDWKGDHYEGAACHDFYNGCPVKLENEPECWNSITLRDDFVHFIHEEFKQLAHDHVSVCYREQVTVHMSDPRTLHPEVGIPP